MPEKESSSVSSDVKIWDLRRLGVDPSKSPVTEHISSVSSFDVEYICDTSYPFLQLVNSEAIFAEETPINFIPVEGTGWIIYDYGDAISVSASFGINAELTSSKKKEVVSKMAELISERGWSSAELVAGTKTMQRLIWMELKRYGIELKGFTPSQDDENCLKWGMRLVEANGLTWGKQPKEKIAIALAAVASK